MLPVCQVAFDVRAWAAPDGRLRDLLEDVSAVVADVKDSLDHGAHVDISVPVRAEDPGGVICAVLTLGLLLTG
jgi:hypothetical protein